MLKNFNIKQPFFEYGPKCYMYGDVLLEIAKGLDALSEKYDVDEFELRKLYSYDEKGFKFFDSEDRYRLDYIKRKVSRPYSIINTMTEGMVEDFFGSWCSDDENYEDLYNPDQNWRIIFPVP